MMSEIELDKKKIESLLPHREPMLLIDKLTKIIREFNSFVYNDHRVESLILPLGDGLSVCRKI